MNFHRKVPKLAGACAAVMLFALALTVHADANAQTSVLPSWNDGRAKQAIISFVKGDRQVCGKCVEPQDPIATFDQDGTLWVEHPLYAQATFAASVSPIL